MEANEVQELSEQQEKAREADGEESRSGMKHVSFTMSVLAVLVAIVTVLGHRTHTEAVLTQARASDQWNLYQAKKIRQNDTQLSVDLLNTLGNEQSARVHATVAGYEAHLAKWSKDLAQAQEAAEGYERHVEVAEKKAGRFDLGEALLEIALVVTSITLLTRLRVYWLVGMGFGALGVLAAILALALR